MVTGTQVTNPSPAGRSRALIIALSFLAGLLVAVGGLLLVVRTSQGLAGTIGSWFQRTTHTNMSRATVVDRIQKLQRLETVVYTMDKIVTGEKGSAVLPDFLAGDKLLLLVHGEVIAGIDFETLKPGDVAVSGRTVH